MNRSLSKYHKYTEFLINELMYIDSLFDLYVYLKNQHVNRIEVLNLSPAFFGLVEKACLDTASICLYRFYDKDKDAITIRKYINYVEQNRTSIFNEIDIQKVMIAIREHRQQLTDFDDKINSLKSVRDTALAHNDSCKLVDDFDVWEGKGINIGDIHALIKFGSDVINTFTHYCENTVHSIIAINKLDVETILQMLEKSFRDQPSYKGSNHKDCGNNVT